MTIAATVTHTKTLVAPDSGSEDKVYGSDYVSATSHTLAWSGLATNQLLYSSGATTLANDGTFDGSILGVSTLRTGDGTASAPGHSFTSETNSGLVRLGSNSFGFYIAATPIQTWGTSTINFFSSTVAPTYVSFLNGCITAFGTAGSKVVGLKAVSAGLLEVNDGTTAGNISSIKAKYVSSGGTAGANFGPSAVASITVVDGIITAIS